MSNTYFSRIVLIAILSSALTLLLLLLLLLRVYKVLETNSNDFHLFFVERSTKQKRGDRVEQTFFFFFFFNFYLNTERIQLKHVQTSGHAEIKKEHLENDWR